MHLEKGELSCNVGPLTLGALERNYISACNMLCEYPLFSDYDRFLCKHLNIFVYIYQLHLALGWVDIHCTQEGDMFQD